MKVLIKEFDGRAHEAEIENTLEALQEIVGGYIEVVPLTFDDIIICNEEGKLYGMPLNFKTPVHDIVGTVIICGDDGEEFTDVHCTVEEFEKLMQDWGNR